MNNKFKKYLAVFITAVFLIGQNFAVTTAFAAPELPDAPDNYVEEVDESSTPETKTEPTPAPTPSTPDAPDTPDNYIENDSQESSENNTPAPTEKSVETETEDVESLTAENLEVPDAPEVDTKSGTKNSGGNTQDGQVGGASIDTGNATGVGSIQNTGNTNVAANQSDATVGGNSGGDISIASKNNGSGSENTGSVAIEDNDITIQNNQADINNELEVDVNTGNNSASKNVGGTNDINTGNATAVGTIINSVNTNIAGAMVSEFNVTDGQNGDLILDYEANCVSGCGSNIELANTGNGSDSTNTTDLDLSNNSSTFQNNDANVVNDLILSANTGNNKTDNNTNGNNSIDTGNATVNGNVINMLNNNIAGNVIYGVVNIIDDFVGDIIVPEKYASAYSSSDISIANLGNGSGSENTGEFMIVDNEDFTQYNEADIINNLVLDANTGGNKTNANTSGNNSIDTGNVNVDASILNIANNNVIGGDWWIVLVNEAGNWFGKIFTPEGALNGGNFAAKGGTSTQSGEDSITLTNDGNGSDSTNNANVSQENNSETVQTNNAKIVNNINLSANTGNNSASRNTGGSNDIDTGNANIQFNLVNFLNNNFAGGNVYLTVVNVFGKWTGDFITPGSKNNNESDNGIGGSPDIPNTNNTANNNSSNSSNNNNNSSSNNSSSSSTNSSSSTPSVLASQSKSNDWFESSTGTGGAIASGEQDENQFELVNTAEASDGAESNSTRRVNLAWAILLLPAFIVIRLIRARFSS